MVVMMKNIFFLGLIVTFVCQASVQRYEQQVASNPSDYRALYNVGVTAFKENDLEKAQMAFDCLKPMCQENAWNDQNAEQLFYNAGNTEVKLQDYAHAVESFEQVLKHNPDNELAQKKLEFAKKMLEEENKQQEKQDQQDQDNKDNKEKDKSKDQSQDDQKDESDSGDNGDDGDDDKDGDDKDKQQKNQDHNKGDDQQDQQSNEKDNENDGDQESKSDQEKSDSQGDDSKQDEQEQQQDGDASDQDNNEPDLTKEEQRLIDALQGHDEKMNKEMGQRMLHSAKGAYDKNNW
jgi:tetratricopeptide (TPR) repeat protein